MSRRVSLPGADELFRTTGGTALQASSPRRQTNGEDRALPADGRGRVPAPAPEGDAAASDGARRPADAGEQAAAGRDSREASQEQGAERHPSATQDRPKGRQQQDGPTPTAQARRRSRAANRRPSGRERHDEKITVYVSAEELMDLEHARLVLRGEHGLAVDRGRIVREAVAVVLADLESRGDASILVRRLRGR
ncbi:hypothetical protein [Streptomyces zagrosensis]|uniref:Cobyrinic acid a,c-diamide synthase n=1 Tax=Streptomyces zagrosensis TaxID=1042984 RepID=A0A7W9UZV2_9ACTN|nr:hypothetical protein [Streptomyces zagrosensis]MBB5937458.1 hypothetical protein [Streptomyces zagrosensis]